MQMSTAPIKRKGYQTLGFKHSYKLVHLSQNIQSSINLTVYYDGYFDYNNWKIFSCLVKKKEDYADFLKIHCGTVPEYTH